MHEFTVYAPAKINLYLDVIGKRPDGYHDIETLFEKIDLKDEITIKEKPEGIDVRVEPISSCPVGKANIVYKAADMLLKKTGAGIGLDIVIKKRIPVSAGLGGGSSDAASVLRGVNEKFALGLSLEDLIVIASEIGKDVAFFLLEDAFAVGKGAGDLLEPVKSKSCFSHILMKPDESFSTAAMYSKIDNHAGIKRKSGIESAISAVKKGDLNSLRESCYNIFERVLGEKAGCIEKAKSLLSGAGAGPCFLSGSGPSVFCILEDKKEAKRIFDNIKKEKGLNVFLAATYKD